MSEEIVREYKAAKSPLKQVGILADLNGCSKERIKEILTRCGCELPAQMRPKPKKEKTAEPEPAAAAAEPTATPRFVRKTADRIAMELTLELLDEYWDYPNDKLVAAIQAIMLMAARLHEEGYE